MKVCFDPRVSAAIRCQTLAGSFNSIPFTIIPSNVSHHLLAKARKTGGEDREKCAQNGTSFQLLTLASYQKAILIDQQVEGIDSFVTRISIHHMRKISTWGWKSEAKQVDEFCSFCCLAKTSLVRRVKRYIVDSLRARTSEYLQNEKYKHKHWAAKSKRTNERVRENHNKKHEQEKELQQIWWRRQLNPLGLNDKYERQI